MRLYVLMHKKLQNVNPKSTEQLAKIVQSRGLEGVWAALGRFWATGSFPHASKTQTLLGASWVDFALRRFSEVDLVDVSHVFIRVFELCALGAKHNIGQC